MITQYQHRCGTYSGFMQALLLLTCSSSCSTVLRPITIALVSQSLRSRMFTNYSLHLTAAAHLCTAADVSQCYLQLETLSGLHAVYRRRLKRLLVLKTLKGGAGQNSTRASLGGSYWGKAWQKGWTEDDKAVFSCSAGWVGQFSCAPKIACQT